MTLLFVVCETLCWLDTPYLEGFVYASNDRFCIRGSGLLGDGTPLDGDYTDY